MYGGESILFLVQIFEIDIFMDLYVLRPLSPKNTFAVGLSLFLCECACGVCVCVCVSLISISNKQNTTETPNLAFYIYLMYRCDLKLFMKIGQIVLLQGHS